MTCDEPLWVPISRERHSPLKIRFPNSAFALALLTTAAPGTQKSLDQLGFPFVPKPKFCHAIQSRSRIR